MAKQPIINVFEDPAAARKVARDIANTQLPQDVAKRASSQGSATGSNLKTSSVPAPAPANKASTPQWSTGDSAALLAAYPAKSYSNAPAPKLTSQSTGYIGTSENPSVFSGPGTVYEIPDGTVIVETSKDVYVTNIEQITEQKYITNGVAGGFNTWEVDGLQGLTSTGSDTVNFVSGSNVTITANNNATPKTLTISAYGNAGLSGFSGYSGSLGPTGSSGYSGLTGVSGYSGISGYDGTSGYSGISGYSGANGSSGLSGYSGVGTSGYSGQVGPSGSSGYSGYSGTSTAGAQTIWIPASAMTARTTGGAATNQVETSTNKIMLSTMNFADGAAVLYAQFNVRMPKSWNEGTVTASFTWTANSTSTNSVVWGLQGVALSNDETIDTAFGTAGEVTDANTSTAYQVHISNSTPAITIGNTPSEQDWVVFQVYRDPTNVNDTLAATALLLGVTLIYTTDATTDN